MRQLKWKVVLGTGLLLFFVIGTVNMLWAADELKIVIMQDKKGAAEKFAPLKAYMVSKGLKVTLIPTPNYRAAAHYFASGKVDAMFSGSGVAGTMIIKDVARPLVRPVDQKGLSTYWAVIVAAKGSRPYTGKADYFKNKKIVFCSLASSGEFYFRSVAAGLKTGVSMMKAPSHDTAITFTAKGMADIAIVKNRVWDSMKDKVPNLVEVGRDNGENPNGTLIVSKKIDAKLAQKLGTILAGLEADTSPGALAVKKKMKIKGYVRTTMEDFAHTLALLKKAGVDSSFNFAF
jgi:ABC-type phosphate/phosphonate transport system substrate-binding protein